MDEVIPFNIWRILLVDDDEDEYYIARSNLNRIEVRHVHLDWAATYEEGVSHIQQNTYDAVLVDYDLGCKTGIELIREMTQKGCSVPLILYTGRGSFEVDLEAMQAGATAYLIKSEATPLFFERSIRYAIERKRIEEDLDRHLQERSAILDSIQGGFIAIDRDWRITYINHAAAEIGDLEPADLIGKNLWEVYPRFHTTLLEENYRKVMAERVPVEFEIPGIYMDKWYSISITPSTQGILVHWQDISARKQGEAALHRYELLSENSRDILLYLNLEDGKILEANAAAVKVYGYTRDELLRRTIHDLRVPELQASIVEQISKANQEGILFETVHRRKDGSTFPVEVSSQGATIGGKRTLISVIRDITERKRSEALMFRINKALHESQNKLKMIVDSIVDGFYVLDQEFRFTFVNTAAMQFFGLKYQDMIGQDLFDLFPAARHSLFEKEYRRAMQSGQPVHFETQSAANPNRMVEIHAYPGSEGLTVLFRDITERHYAETALRMSEEKYHSLFDSMTEGFAIHEILLDDTGQPCDYRFLEVNPAFEMLTGLKHNEILGKTYNEVIGDGEMTWIQKYGQVALTGNPIHFENYSPALRKHYEVYAYRSAPNQFAVIFMDITHRKQVEAALRDANQTLKEQAEELEVQAEELRQQTDQLLVINESLQASEENYRRIVETANEGIWITDKSSRTILVNPKMADMLGYALDEMIGASFFDFVDPEDLILLENKERDLKKGIREQYELQLKCKDGRKIWVMVSGSPILEGGELVAHLGMMTDITERKLALEALHINEKRLVDYLESMNELFFSIDFEDRFIYANQRYCETLGLNQKDTIGKNLWELFPRYLGTDIEENYRKAMDERTPVRFPIDGIYTDKWYEVSIYPIQEGIAVFVTDRTEVHKAEELLTERTNALQEYAMKLEQSNKALEDFAFIASHDLKEPLRKINTFGSLIFSNYKPCLDEQGQDYIRRMQDAAGRMQRMLDGLLDYSKVTTQGRPFVKIDLTELTHSVISDLDVRLQETEGQIKLEELPVIEGDRMQIRQVMQNLIGNALKFHREGVPPVVKIYQRRGTSDQELGNRIKPEGPDHQPLVTIVVEDNGIGFDMKNIDCLFQPFNRLVGRSDYEGSGMGLAICRKIAEKHGGSINAYSIPGEGSIFIVKLPGKWIE